MFGTSCDDALIALNYMPLDYAVIYCLGAETHLHVCYISAHIRDMKFLRFIDLTIWKCEKVPLYNAPK